MGSALIIYGSTTGNTEYVATLIQREMINRSHTITLLNVSDASMEDLNVPHDVYLLGGSA